MITNKIGLEAEFFLRDASGVLLYPSKYGFATDEFCILGEFRGDPGVTRQEALGNFLKAYYETLFLARKHGLTLDIKTGWTAISPAFHAEIMRTQGIKNVAQCQNIYNTDILTQSDAKCVRGKIVERYVSAGLHVHFSSEEIDTREIGMRVNQDDLNSLFGSEQVRAALHARLSAKQKDSITVRASRISKPVIKGIVEAMDKSLLPEFVTKDGTPKLKYRLPGFYETKSWGFEYRSLPFNQKSLTEIDKIVDKSFSLLESL